MPFVFAILLSLVSIVPQVTSKHVLWKAPSGHCDAEFQHVTVERLPPGVANVVNTTLERMERNVAMPAAAERAVACEKDYHDAFGSATSLAGQTPHLGVFGEWTVGIRSARWLSMRLHAMYLQIPSAHPSDDYASVTFDLAHGGYPVPTSGFYAPGRRERFNAILYDADLREMRSLAKEERDFSVDSAYLKQRDAGLSVNATQILVRAKTIEVTNVDDSGALRNYILQVDDAALFAIGTANGPLDPRTRGKQ